MSSSNSDQSSSQPASQSSSSSRGASISKSNDRHESSGSEDARHPADGDLKLKDFRQDGTPTPSNNDQLNDSLRQQDSSEPSPKPRSSSTSLHADSQPTHTIYSNRDPNPVHPTDIKKNHSTRESSSAVHHAAEEARAAAIAKQYREDREEEKRQVRVQAASQRLKSEKERAEANARERRRKNYKSLLREGSGSESSECETEEVAKARGKGKSKEEDPVDHLKRAARKATVVGRIINQLTRSNDPDPQVDHPSSSRHHIALRLHNIPRHESPRIGDIFVAQTLDTTSTHIQPDSSTQPSFSQSSLSTSSSPVTPITPIIPPTSPSKAVFSDEPESITLPSSEPTYAHKRGPSVSSNRSKAPSQAKDTDWKGKGRAIWCLEWSVDGRYLASAGQDGVVRLYRTLGCRDDSDGPSSSSSSPSSSTSSPPDHTPAPSTSKHHRFASGSLSSDSSLPAKVVEDRPFREWTDHTDGVLSLAWSKNGFLISSSMDHTVRLFHPSRPDHCLAIFAHPDTPTSIAFHPKDDRFFASGCLDHKMRVWSIVEKSVRHVGEVAEGITAVAFSLDGQTVAAGTFSGQIDLFSNRLEHCTSIQAGRVGRGHKITGIQFISLGNGDDSSDEKTSERMLVSSNDSRIRIFRTSDKVIEVKFSGHVNKSSQIGASLGGDRKFLISGSEDGQVFLWNPDKFGLDGRGRSVSFQADYGVITRAILAPLPTRRLLARANDPIYTDLPSEDDDDECFSRQSSLAASAASPSIPMEALLRIPSMVDTLVGDGGGGQGKGKQERMRIGRSTTFEEVHVESQVIAVATSHGTITIYRSEARPPMLEEGSESKRRNWFGKRRPL